MRLNILEGIIIVSNWVLSWKASYENAGHARNVLNDTSIIIIINVTASVYIMSDIISHPCASNVYVNVSQKPSLKGIYFLLC